MKLIYLTRDSRAVIESTKLRGRMIEMPDGYHPVTNDSVWQDAKRQRDSLMVVVEDVRGAYGATMEENDVALLLYEMELNERAFKRDNVSKMWWRAFSRMLSAAVKFIPMAIMAIIILWTVYDSFLGGR